MVKTSSAFRALLSGAVFLSGIVTLPTSASASATNEYVIVERDGSVAVRRLTQSQAITASVDPAVRIVQPNRQIHIDETPTEIVSGLSVPANAHVGDIIPGRYIVRFSSNTASAVAAAAVPASVITTFSQAMNGFVADLSPAELKSLQANPNVVGIEADSVVAATTDQSWPGWGLDRIDQRALPLNRTYSYTSTGAGVTAYVIDTGIYSAHSEFTDRIQPGFTAVADGNGTEDCNGHGTHVAGTVAGTTYGVAKSASIVPVRVLGCTGSGTVSGVISGLNWAMNNHVYGVPAVANLSIGSSYSFSFNLAVSSAVYDGITVVVAAGNDNGDACIKSPASEPTAITVGATAADDSRASYSNFGSCVDIFAPGSSITSAYVGSPTSSASMSGTSMASPHAAGVAALYLQAHPSATPAAVATAITEAATKDAISNVGNGSPNRLLYSQAFSPAPDTVPSAPLLVYATPMSQTVALTWAPPASDGGSAITDYNIEYKTSGATNWNFFVDAISTTRLAKVTGLVNGTQYSFRVSAVNAVGVSTPSLTVLSTPFAPATLTAPRSLTGQIGRQSVTLSWLEPSSTGGHAVTDYIIESTIDAGLTWTTLNDGVSTALTYPITGLTANISYAFRVTAVNSVGLSPASNTVILVPAPLDPPAPVENLKSSPRILGAYVSWDIPFDNGGSAIEGYVIDYSSDGGLHYSTTTRVEDGKMYSTLSGLNSGVEYTVRVRAVNVNGIGRDATTLVTPTAVVQPGAPGALSVYTKYNAATLYWSAPTSNGGSRITGYVAEYSTDSGVTWTRSSVSSANFRSMTYSNLVGGVVHQFRVYAINAIGISDASNMVEATPVAPTVSSAPRNITGFITGSSAYVSWTRPVMTGGSPIATYSTWMSTDDGATWNVVTTSSVNVRHIRITDLVGGMSYQFRVTAANAIGDSAPSPSITLQPRIVGTPNPPSSVAATVKNTSVNLSWSSVVAKAAPVTDYIVEYSTDSSSTWITWDDGVSTATSAILTNMAPDIAVTLRVKAVNSYGTSPASASVSVTPRSIATTPTAPLSISTTVGDTRIAVRWTTPANTGGSPIIGYTVTSNPGGFTCVTDTNACVVLDLTNGVSYTFTVTATNAIGTGPASEPSGAVTPVVGGIPATHANSWGLDRTDQRALPLDQEITRGGTGAGVTAYIIDTGVYAGSAEFGNRVGTGFTSIDDGNGTTDCHGHGTHVAGTVAGSSYGFATEATIIPVRVLSCVGSGSSFGVVAGINWVIDNHQAGVPAVANMSLGGGYDLAVNDAVARAVADGITFVVAAGNSADDACSYSPASEPTAITVGATTSIDSIAYYSNVGSCVDVLAPGTGIISAGITSPTATVQMSGTSMASPHVAGVAAVTLGNSPSLTPAQVISQLTSNATQNAVTGIDTSTVNALLYQQPASANSFSFDNEIGKNSDGADTNASDSSTVEYEEDPGVATTTNTVTTPTEPQNSSGATPATPTDPHVSIVATPATPDNPEAQPALLTPGLMGHSVQSAAPSSLRSVAVSAVVIKKITRVGKNLRIAITAPKGAQVKLYRNGKLVGKGVKSVFVVPVSVVKKQRFTAVVSIAGALVSSASVALPIRSASLR